VSVKEKFDQSEIDRIVEDEKKIMNKIKKGKYSEFIDEEAEDEEDDEGYYAPEKTYRSKSNSQEKNVKPTMVNKFQDHKMKNLEKAQIGKMEEENQHKKRAAVIEEDDDIPVNDDFIVRDDEDDFEEEKLAKSKIHTFNNKSGILGTEDIYIQAPFNVGSTTIKGSRNYISWNLKGKLILVKTVQFDHVELSFSLEGLQPTTIANKFKFTMGDINWNGVLLASRGEYDIDSYEDEFENSEQKKNAKLFYVSSNNELSWTVSLKDAKEHIVAVALSNSFAACATDKNYLRFFSPLGIENFVLGVSQVITLCAYENLLAIFYHASLPFSGSQCIQLKLFDTKTLRVCCDCAVTLSPKSDLKWCGFSSNGILYVQDSSNTLWTLVNRHVWACVYTSDSNLWIIGI